MEMFQLTLDFRMQHRNWPDMESQIPLNLNVFRVFLFKAQDTYWHLYANTFVRYNIHNYYGSFRTNVVIINIIHETNLCYYIYPLFNPIGPRILLNHALLFPCFPANFERFYLFVLKNS